ncbi:MAG TPA: hypothetical protein VFY87_00190 [Geminicoccaceae bacterium]|nr:hypothetical protein [Geminicoccaceae bacterium]
MSELIFGWLARPWVPWALAGLIVASAVAIWLDFRYRRIAPVMAGLRRAIALVEESEGPSGFKRRFQTIYKGLADNPVVGEVWRAYASTIAPAPGLEDALGYSRRPRENFDEGLLAVAGVNLRLYHAIPNLLVGSGLLFTFLGLIAALFFASQAIAGADIGEAQHALRELLAAATFKFVTSVAGLGCSLVFSWREKALLHRVQRLLARLCAALEERMVPITSESLAMNQLGELKAQHAELRRMSRNLILRVPEEIEARLAEELGGAVVPLRHAIAQAAGRLERLDEVVTEALLNGLAPDPSGAPTGPASRLAPAARVLRARLDALAGDAAATDPRPGGAARSSPTEDLADAALAGTPVLRRLDERLGEVLLRLRDGIAALARLGGGRRGSRPAEVLRALAASEAGLQEARQAAADLGWELEHVAGAAAAVAEASADAVPHPPGAPAGQQQPKAAELAARLTRLESHLGDRLHTVETQLDLASTRLAEAVVQLDRAERR